MPAYTFAAQPIGRSCWASKLRSASCKTGPTPITNPSLSISRNSTEQRRPLPTNNTNRKAANTAALTRKRSEAASFNAMADEAGWSRVLAGVQFPSDHYAGKALGQSVAEQVIAQADTDGSSATWTGTVPTGPCKWIGTNPGNVTAANWRPLLLCK